MLSDTTNKKKKSRTVSASSTKSVSPDQSNGQSSSSCSSLENSNSGRAPSVSLDISPIENPKGLGSKYESTLTSYTSMTSIIQSNDNIFNQILERISKIEEDNSKLRLDNDFLEDKLTSIGEKNFALEKKVTKLTTDLSELQTKYQSKLDNMNNLIQFHATENVALIGAMKEEILDHVFSRPNAANETSDGSNDTSTSQPTISNKTLHDEFASLSQDNAVLNEKIDNLHAENLHLNDSLDLVISRVRELFLDNEALHGKMDALTDTKLTNKTDQPIVYENLQGEINTLQKKVYEVEKELYKTNQYNRRQNLVIDGIPDKIPQHDLERTVVQIISKLGVHVHPREVVGCHRLVKPSNNPNSPTPTIIRFTNRKVSEICIRNKRFLDKLRFPWKLDFREDLCEANDVIRQECEVLKERGFIHQYIVRNGFVKTISKKGDFPRKINHPDDLFSMFPDNLEPL